MKRKTILSGLRGGAAVFLSLAVLCGLGLGLAQTWRTTVDSALGTSSYKTSSEDEVYVSSYDNAEDLMNDIKDFAVTEGQEGTVIMKNTEDADGNTALPLASNSEVALFGLASYDPYFSAAGNSDQVDLVGALEEAGYTVNSTLSSIYESILDSGVEPNESTGDYDTYQIIEVDPADFSTEYGASVDWESSISSSDTAIITFMRPGGEGTTYKPGSALDPEGNATGKNPLALSDEELAVVAEAKELCDKVVVLLNTSCTIEVDPLVNDPNYEVDAIAYIGIPNDYQFEGIVDVLGGEVNSTGRMADTYAADSTSSPAMENFGGAYYTDYEEVLNFTDERWPGVDISNEINNSFGGVTTYSGGYYIVEAEGIYTGYNYYETRYYDSIVNPSYGASSSSGVTQTDSNGAALDSWDYDEEVNYTFGSGLSYIPYTQTITNVEVEDTVDGDVTATVEVENLGTEDGKFTIELYVSQPYTDYDRTNLVEKSAIMFLNSKVVEVDAGQTEEFTITIPTKYLASYDYTNAKTYVMDGGVYYFTVGNGAHEAVNNVILAQNDDLTASDLIVRDGEVADGNNVATWENGLESDCDTVNYATSESGGTITNEMDNVDLNYYLEDEVTYLSRQDWENTWPINYCEEENRLTLADSPKEEEWLKELRNQQYEIQTDDPCENIDGIPSVTFSKEDIPEEAYSDITNEYWDQLVQAIPAEEAVGAVAHGGSQSDTLTNINNPVVVQNDGPRGFNNKTLSNNNYDDPEEDRYYVDPSTEAGQFLTNVNSQSLLGTTFDPDLALEWGELLGNAGLWLREYQIWGVAVNYHRTPYNGRNTEYVSEDPMLSNVLGTAMVHGTNEYGIVNGPKHIGHNDQEHDRSGLCVYMNEQKFRQTDLRCFQGSVEEADAKGLMTAFNRVGAVNASHSVGMIEGIIKGEWGFEGLISTDLMSNGYYFNPEGCINAGITMMADFPGDNSHLNLGSGGVDATWTYLSPEVVYQDNYLVEKARDNLKYQFYAYANSAVLDTTTTYSMPWWEATLISVCAVTAVIGALLGIGYIVVQTFGLFKKEAN